MLFTWHWWFNLALTIVPWVVWIIIRKKDSTYRLLTAGLFSMFLSSFLDVVGVALGLWGYNSVLIPLIPPFSPWDSSLFPVAVMIFIQYCPKINIFLKAIIYSAISSFIVEPFFALINFYEPKHWNYFYSFIIVIIIYLICDFLTTRKSYKEI